MRPKGVRPLQQGHTAQSVWRGALLVLFKLCRYFVWVCPLRPTRTRIARLGRLKVKRPETSAYSKNAHGPAAGGAGMRADKSKRSRPFFMPPGGGGTARIQPYGYARHLHAPAHRSGPNPTPGVALAHAPPSVGPHWDLSQGDRRRDSRARSLAGYGAGGWDLRSLRTDTVTDPLR